MFNIKILLLLLGKKLWARATLFALLAIITAFASVLLKDFIPKDLPNQIGSDTVGTILNILASSMLAVTTFSLTTMVSAYGAATSNVTPRATKLLMEDSTTHNVLSTFLGSFIFSLVGIISLNIGYYDDRSRAVLFIVTLGVIAFMLVTLIHWIEHLTKLGRVGATTQLVEKVTADSLLARAKKPCLGANPLINPDEQIPPDAYAIKAEKIGYIQFIDIEKLSEIAKKHDARFYLPSLPGTFVTTITTLAMADCDISEEDREKISSCFVIEDERSYEQDPRFGLCILAEIAARALSSAINDTGTPIDVIGRTVRLLCSYANSRKEPKIHYSRLWIPPLKTSDLFSDIFLPISRYAGNSLEVQVRLQKAFEALHAIPDEEFKECAKKYSFFSHEYAMRNLILDEEKKLLEELVIK